MGRGLLVFKGDEKAKKKKKKSKQTKPSKQHDDFTDQSLPPQQEQQKQQPEASASAETATSKLDNHASSSSMIRDGTGSVSVSGTVVTGHGTRFQKELRVGDAFLLVSTKEMRIIKMVLSDTSCGISSPFTNTNTAITEAPFQYIPKPKTIQSQQLDQLRKQQKQMEEREEIEQSAFGTYRNNTNGDSNVDTLVYRERTEHGNYRIQTVQLKKKNSQETISRSELLQMRAKKASDKYC